VFVLRPRRQGDAGEGSAIEWLPSRGLPVFVPLNHSPDDDLVAELGGGLVRVQVKTSRRRTPYGRFDVMLATMGADQSWTGVVKRLNATRDDRLFVLTADGRRRFIPSERIEGTRGLLLGGSKHPEREIEPGRPFGVEDAAPLDD